MINTEMSYPQKGSPVRADIWEKIVQRLDAMATQSCKVLAVRFDVRFPQGYPHDGKNTELSALISTLKEGLTYHGILTHYVWV